MGKDNQPKHRQKSRDLRRISAQRAPYERLLIVSEGEKTEPQYVNEIRIELRLSTANVQVSPGALGTEPRQVVEYAHKLFLEGDRSKNINARAFDRVIMMFDRDDHFTYHQALAMVEDLDNKLKNDAGDRVPFQAIVSVPCFELWLLLHFEDVHAPIHRNTVYQRLKTYLPGYQKGQNGHWAATRDRLDTAVEYARNMARATNAHDDHGPYTAIYELVLRLLHLKD